MALLSALVRWALNNRPVVLAATVLFALLGLDSARRLPIDAVPDVTNVQVAIITAAPALSPIEVEQYVTVPVERAMAGLPRLTQVRSVSKGGLSVVTVVFTDETDIYFARQLVMERMKEAEDAVPPRYGRPEMGPITTGMGEVFQFVVRGEGHLLMELEELLDWYIGPQLRMVPGVVEANSFGGENKQYQVIVDPARLQSLGLSLQDVDSALEKSNANAGGGYIEHQREHFVIGSSGLVTSLQDLQNVVIGATSLGAPILLSQVADVRLGPRLRHGAASMDGQGEVVVGVAMMLMGENSRTVTEAVKQRLAELAPSLPAGVIVQPFYDRSVLVNRTIRTVAVNLLEGACLVIAVLFLLLGGLRAGLVAAVTIPLALLFALVMMRVRGDSGNLMSLGAIDFGLVVDGAVIIVENAVRRLGEMRQRLGRMLTPDERLDTVRESTLEVRSATVFGEMIIAIVYVPILVLGGTEGKLFRPMATTVLLALTGAFILSLTVVPVLASLVLVPEENERPTLLMRAAVAAYDRLLRLVTRFHRATVAVALAAVVATVVLFGRLGAEFVPTLDEGDLLVEARRLPGVALSETVATDSRMQRALARIPEVLHVVSRAGAPELATDPMGLEQSDNYVILKARDDWRPGVTKESIAQEAAELLEEHVPEVAVGLSQPIEMRTNELMEGVRSDVAAFVYGPDLDVLKTIGEQLVAVLGGVRGAVDVRAEQVAGLRYLRVDPDRPRLARYGLTVEDINLLTESLAVGHRAGTVYEGERRFELVLRIGHTFTGELDAIRSLPLRSASGQMVPLGDVASVRFEDGPAQVSREQQSRRLTVEFNVRDRDLLSTVEDARSRTAALRLPTGYRVEWGGQFQSFLEARGRLAVAVPLSLALILLLLWMAFRAVAPALLIFSAIPFSVVGGVLALLVRGLPFSISAGVGFIALSGVAVLNGLVLVTFARRLELAGTQANEAITAAATLRLRPVLMTAAVAALGFMPMAVSTAPGSEVQRPLATVVIGGLVSSTALTLLVLPAIYRTAFGLRMLVRRRRQS
ncbi:MAG: efflux RND transporter permease subunit [Deltaproteobacteria bacterium]|nr:efflux RND transporter permease subunit [Deltaproteobacteria bacterium]